MKNTKYKGVIALLILCILLVIGYIAYTNYSQNKLDNLAKCLTEKKVIMYGASWCSHCADQKSAFGSSFKYINYYNCSDNPDMKDKVCIDKKIEKYPTWIQENSIKVEGVYYPATLAKTFGCDF